MPESLIQQVAKFSRLGDKIDLDRLVEFLCLLQAINKQIGYAGDRDKGLKRYTEKHGLLELASKLPEEEFREWVREADSYMRANRVDPDLGLFIRFINGLESRLSNPYFRSLHDLPKDPAEDKPNPKGNKKGTENGSSSKAKGAKTSFRGAAARVEQTEESKRHCSYHDKSGHWLSQCKSFLRVSAADKVKHLDKHKLCHKCALKHDNACKRVFECYACGKEHMSFLHDVATSSEVHTALAVSSPSSVSKSATPTGPPQAEVASAADSSSAKLPTKRSARAAVVSENTVRFSKTQIVYVRHRSVPDKVLRCCALVDEQSKDTFADGKIASKVAVDAKPCEYNLETLAGLTTRVNGLELDGLQVRGNRSNEWYDLPPAFTGSHLPDSRGERATYEIVQRIPSLSHLAHHFDPEDPEPEVLLLIGNNMDWAYKLHCEGKKPPFAHRNIFGWSVVGSVSRDLLPEGCLALTLAHGATRSFRGNIVSEVVYSASPVFSPRCTEWVSGSDVFESRHDDEELSRSADDDTFMRTLMEGTKVRDDGFLEIPLPLKSNASLPDNEVPVYFRSKATLDRAKKDPKMLERTMRAMQQFIDRNYMEKVPVPAY